MEQVVGEIGVVMGEGAAHVVALTAAGLDQLLELGHNAVIAAAACNILAETVVDLLAAIQRKNHVVALFVGPLNDFIGDADAVGGQGEAEVLAFFFFNAASIGNQLFADLKVHQRFAAEKVNLQVVAGAAVLHQEIQRTLAGLKAHQAGLAVELALGGKAVFAVQIAGVGHMQAECLDNGGTILEVKGMVSVNIFGKQLAIGLQFFDIVKAVVDVFGGHFGMVSIFLCQQVGSFCAGVAGIDQSDGGIRQFVYGVNAAAVDIQHNVVAVEFILMDHTIPHIRIKVGLHKKNRERLFGKRQSRQKASSSKNYFFSQGWLAMPQLVLQALWQEVWHSPQPPFWRLLAISRVFRV